MSSGKFKFFPHSVNTGLSKLLKPNRDHEKVKLEILPIGLIEILAK